MSGLPIALLIFLTIAILLRMDLLFYLVYVLTGIYALARWWAGRTLPRMQFCRRFTEHIFVGETVKFVRDLEAAWPDAQPDLQALTEAFVAARYASRDIAPVEAQHAQGVWQRIMAILRRPREGEHSSDRGA